MSQARTLLSLGDVMRAFGYLQPVDARTQEAIVALLGTQQQSVQKKQPVHTVPPVPFIPLRNPSPDDGLPLSKTPSTQLDTPLKSTLEKEETGALTTHPVIVPLPEEPSFRSPPPQPDPLFFPAWRRNILSTALATRSDDGLPDIDALLARLVLMKPIEWLPRHSIPTLRQGVQILVDRNETLEPFRLDQEDLVQAMFHLVGSDKVHVLEFIGSPLRGVSDPDIGWRPYQPPATGTVVALLTDLSIMETPLAPKLIQPEEWLLFKSMLHRMGCPVVAFVPYATRRWPDALAHMLKIIPWDRSTTVSTVHHINSWFKEAGL